MRGPKEGDGLGTSKDGMKVDVHAIFRSYNALKQHY